MDHLIKIAIAEDNPYLLKQLQIDLQQTGKFDIVCKAVTGKDLLKKLPHCKSLPEVILMDIEMPEMDGIETTRVLSEQLPNCKILMLTVFDDEEKIFAAVVAGAKGYLLKETKIEKICTAIDDILAGGGSMSPLVALKAINYLKDAGTKKLNELQPHDYNLSKRETEILQLLALGKATKSISEVLFISVGTVRKHVENIYAKLHVNSKLQAVQTAGKHNWFS